MEKAVEITELTKYYETGFWRKQKVCALDALDLTLEKGKILGFLGGNGAGKTTTIKLLMQLIFPTAGEAKILGQSISDFSMHSRIGYCPENPYFYDHLTARELMDFFGSLFGYNKKQRSAKAEELLTAVGLSEKDWNKQLRKFSKGMLQRVGLAQSLINDPEILFLDEPMSGLDPVGRREVRELISNLRSNGTTIFMCSHILSDIEALCDEVAILRRGKLVANGALSDLLTNTGEGRVLEVSVQGVESEAIREDIEFIAGAVLFPKPGGCVIQLLDESDIDAVLKVTRNAGGRLASIQRVKQSLEELFVESLVGPDKA